MHDGVNRIFNNDRILLIKELGVKELVYAKSVRELTDKHKQFLKLPEVVKHPKFSQHMQSLWGRTSDRAHCYCAAKLVQGNRTNKYAEAGMRILKELIFSCVKAYNIIQMFQFVTETMERYYQSKLLSVVHTRVDHFVSVLYQGLNAKQYLPKDSITKLSDSTFSVASKTE